MIIIKTKTGETIVNENEIVSVVHDRDKHTAHINDKQVGFGLCRPPIDKVERVIYINSQTGDNGGGNQGGRQRSRWAGVDPPPCPSLLREGSE